MTVEKLLNSQSAERLPSLNALRAFEAAGRYLNFRAAADELGVTQGAVAQQVRGLEAELGLKLFDRLPRTLALTEAGRTYHRDIVRAFALIREATGVLRPAPSQVTISVTPTFASKWLIPRLPDFTTAHPAIDLRILATESVSSFHTDRIDLAVRQTHPPFGANLRADLLFEQEIVAVCSPNLLPDGRGAVSLDAFVRLGLLHDTHNFWPEFLEAAFSTAARQEIKGVRFSQTSLALDAAMAGQGVALASLFLVARDLAAGRLLQPVPARLAGPQDFYLLAPRDPRNPAATSAVRDWLLGRRDMDISSLNSA